MVGIVADHPSGLSRRTMFVRLVLDGAALALLLFLGVGACSDDGFGRSGRADQTYRTQRAEIGDVRDVVPAIGVVEALTTVEVVADIPGRVETVLVEPNQSVVRGQPLARIDAGSLSYELQEAGTAVSAAEAALAEIRVRSEQAQRQLGDRRRLVERGLYSPAAARNAEDEARQRLAAVRRAQSELDAARVRAANARSRLGKVVIRAPQDGFVLARNLEAGQVVGPGASEKPLFVIASRLDAIVVEAAVAETDIRRVTPAARVAFTVDAHPGEVFEGRLRDVLREPKRERSAVTYAVLIDADNPEGKLFPGMTASVEFIHQDARNVLHVPIEALYYTPEDYRPELPEEALRYLRRTGEVEPRRMQFVEMGMLLAQGRQRIFVLENRKPAMRTVQVGAQTDEVVEVRNGLRPGEVVILGKAPPARVAERASE